MQRLAYRRRLAGRRPARLTAGIDWFLPPGIQDSDLDSYRRARLVVVFVWILLLAGTFYVALFWWVGSTVSAAAAAIAVAVAVGILLLMRRIGAGVVAGNPPACGRSSSTCSVTR